MINKKMHTLTEGQRVHYLANLGGLVAICGLEDYPPNILVGALSSVSRRLTQLPNERLEKLKLRGDTLLKQRATDKISFKRWQRAQQTERFDLSRDHIKKLISKLGGELPVLEKDLAPELRRLVSQL